MTVINEETLNTTQYLHVFLITYSLKIFYLILLQNLFAFRLTNTRVRLSMCDTFHLYVAWSPI